MNRLLVQMAHDVRLQYRSGFYLASVVIALPSALLIGLLDADARAWVLPLVLFENAVINAYFFIAGLLLLERAEGSLAAAAVAPLRDTEHLAAKMLTLAALSTVEGCLITLIAHGVDLNWPILCWGLLTASLLFALPGVVMGANYPSINEFLMPSVAVTVFLSIPILTFLGLVDGWLWQLHPLQPAMNVLAAAYDPSRGLNAYDWLAPMAWLAAGWFWTASRYRRLLVGP